MIPSEYRDLFGYGSQVSGDAADYPSPSDLLSVLASVHEQTLTETRAMPDEVLDESVVFDDPQIAQSLIHI